MAVNINTVYKRVLAIANKEQRGYITPQEFNVFANQAQMDIFEQYFYDYNQFVRIHGNDSVFGDAVEILKEKISEFEATAAVASGTTLPTDLYRLVSVQFNNVEASYVSNREYSATALHPLLRPNDARPVYTRQGGSIKVFGNAANNQAPEQKTTSVNCEYIKTPTDVNWGYNVVLGKPIYNAATSVNFELHESEEVSLVNRILILASITIEDPQLSQAANIEEAKDIQQKKQ